MIRTLYNVELNSELCEDPWRGEALYSDSTALFGSVHCWFIVIVGECRVQQKALHTQALESELEVGHVKLKLF